MATTMERDYMDSRWVTYKQAAKEGWQVKPGERGTQIEFWDTPKVEKGSIANEGSEDSSKSDDSRPRLIRRVYTVFSASQIEGISA